MTDHTPTPEEQAWTDAKLDPNPVSQPPAPAPKPRRWPWVAGIVAALLVGIGIGGASADDVEPEVITETVTETVTETIEVTPQICVEAIEYAYDGFDIAGEFGTLVGEYPGLMMEAVEAAVLNHAARLNAVTERVEVMTGRLNETAEKMGDLAPDWQAAALTCQLLADAP